MSKSTGSEAPEDTPAAGGGARRRGGRSSSGSSAASGRSKTWDFLPECLPDIDCCFVESLFKRGGPDIDCCLAEASFGPDCFVATATLDTPDHPDLTALRAFRDKILARTPPGRLFIHAYYRYGSHAARFIRNKPALKLLIREGLVRPLARLSRLLVRGR